MTCTHIQDLLPLFTGGDLSLQKADSVRAHLFACQDCSSAAADYEASQSWLSSSSKPNFDDLFFESLRESVWRDIRTEANAAPRASAWTWLLATVTLALLCAGVFIARRDASRGKGTQIQPPIVGEEAHRVGPSDSSGAREPSPKTIETRRTRGSMSNVKRLHVLTTRWEPGLPELPSMRNHLVEAIPLTPLIPMTVLGTFVLTASSNRLPVETSPVLRRMEIQTSDPTVRIIWLVAEETPRPLVDLDLDININE
ncbi:MAG: zf-HC2 domain-containing protein [Acidobacteriota bacterium]